MTQLSVSNPSQLLTNLFGVPAIVSDVLSLVIQDQLPDIYAPFYERYATASRASFIETMFHELSHTSHYTKAGPAFWPYLMWNIFTVMAATEHLIWPTPELLDYRKPGQKIYPIFVPITRMVNKNTWI